MPQPSHGKGTEEETKKTEKGKRALEGTFCRMTDLTTADRAKGFNISLLLYCTARRQINNGLLTPGPVKREGHIRATLLHVVRTGDTGD